MAIQYPATSAYATTPQTSWHIDLYKFRKILPDNGDRFIRVAAKYNNRPDLLSYDLYGTPGYWWVFLIRNMNIIRDPIWDFTAGIDIYVPSVDYLRTVVG